ncbi:MoxR family ATPase [Agreia sp. VKM Ac-1783]|uniref:AAA family ATPase n=1 Tax=Agreia sp. VKM Ac-1783 TaxID=1938889 RepID=UPI000A2AC65C|nr:MoxR family ATPase [Agreia sp. VKM Ac-1783]SMQ60972.1 MoxR-like ATPase [Agreia sp. VKM Ac-1783]
MPNRWNKISASPTRTGAGVSLPGLTAEDLFRQQAPQSSVALDEKLRQVYYWLVNTAVISPFYDIEFSFDAPLSFPLGDAGAELHLPTDQSYSSNVLLPLLTFALGGKCLLVGGPGRGKTTLAVLMGVIAGSTPQDVRRSVQQGQPQLTVSDLVGMPLPRDLVNAASLPEIEIAWRGWLTRPVKIIDEYNRIPTKTQSALLTMVAEGYVESYDQMLSTAPESGVESWFFTANDDAGGGTFPVIQALKDRVDVTVAALGFNSRFFDELVTRVEAGEKPEENVPSELVFAPAEQQALAAAIRAVPVPQTVRRQLEFFASQFEFVQHGGRRFEYRTKDTVMTGGGQVGEVIDSNTGADLQVDIGAQTTNSLSARALQSLITYAKAMAYFRGVPAVGLDDVAAVLPFSLRGKLLPNELHPRFETGADRELATDQVSWLADLFEQSCRQFASLGLAKTDPVGDLLATFAQGLDGVSQVEGSRRLTAIESQIQVISRQKKLYGRHFDDLVALKYLHQRYTNYLRWLESRPR